MQANTTKLVTRAIITTLLFYLSTTLFAQYSIKNDLYINIGAFHLNPKHLKTNMNLEYTNIRKPFISNEFGYNRLKNINNNFVFIYGASIIQNRIKFETQLFVQSEKTISNAYLSIPLKIGYNFKKTFISVGPALDYYLYSYTNYNIYNGITGTEINQYNKFTPWAISFIEGEIPISFHLESKIISIFSLKNEQKIGFSIAWNIFEVASFYGRNFSIDENSNNDYYYPTSLTFGISYLWE